MVDDYPISEHGIRHQRSIVNEKPVAGVETEPVAGVHNRSFPEKCVPVSF